MQHTVDAGAGGAASVALGERAEAAARTAGDLWSRGHLFTRPQSPGYYNGVTAGQRQTFGREGARATHDY
jgi:hypothetical protein